MMTNTGLEFMIMIIHPWLSDPTTFLPHCPLSFPSLFGTFEL